MLNQVVLAAFRTKHSARKSGQCCYNVKGPMWLANARIILRIPWVSLIRFCVAYLEFVPSVASDSQRRGSMSDCLAVLPPIQGPARWVGLGNYDVGRR